MMTGREALGAMERAIAEVRAGESRLDQSLRSAEGGAARLRAERIESFKALASVKLDLMLRDEFVGQLDAAERRAREILTRRDNDLRALAQRREAAATAVAEAEKARHARAETLEDAVERLDALTARARAEAREGEGWAEREKAVEAARAVATEADKKAAVAEGDLLEKRKPYEADPLFMYLWNRKFGTSACTSGPFVRFFDRKVATLIGYDGARANYHMLNEIPLRLRAHADRAAAAVEEARGSLASMETTVLEAKGGKELTEEVQAKRTALAASEQQLASAQQVLAGLDQQHNALVQGENDASFQQAIAIIAEADSRLDLETLRREARQTRTADDERIVERIAQVDSAIERADQEVAAIRKEMRDLAQRRVEIERVRDESRRRGYDNPFGTVRNGPEFSDTLGNVLKGALGGVILDRVLRDGYRERAHHWEPDFGRPGGGLNFPQWPQGGGTPPGGGTPQGGGWTGGWTDWIGSGGVGGGDGGGVFGGGGGGGDFSSGDSF